MELCVLFGAFGEKKEGRSREGRCGEGKAKERRGGKEHEANQQKKKVETQILSKKERSG